MKRLNSLALILAFLSSFPDPAFSSSSDLIMPTGVSSDRFATEIMWMAVKKLPVPDRPKIVLVLGGGGARGLCHIGVLRVMEEEGIPIDEIVGVSVGALIGGLYAAGVSVNDIEKMAGEVGWNKLTDFSKVRLVNLILTEDLLSTERMETYLKAHIGEKFFSELKIPFSCVATDLKTGEKVVFKEGPVAIAARASSTVPGLFKPVAYRQRYLVDGGIVDNLPTDLVSREENTFVIAVLPRYVSEPEEIPNALLTLLRSMEIQGTVIVQQNRNKADFLIDPFVGDVSLVQLSRYKECVQAGVLAGRENVPKLKMEIIRKVLDKLKMKSSK